MREREVLIVPNGKNTERIHISYLGDVSLYLIMLLVFTRQDWPAERERERERSQSNYPLTRLQLWVSSVSPPPLPNLSRLPLSNFHIHFHSKLYRDHTVSHILFGKIDIF